MKTKLFALVLFLLPLPSLAGKLVGAVDTDILSPTVLAQNSVIVVEASKKKGARNLEFHARRFAEELKKKFPNTFYGSDYDGDPDIFISVQAKSDVDDVQSSETVYTQEPTSWRCSELNRGVECNVKDSERRAIGSKQVTYSLIGYKLTTSWMFPDAEGSYSAKFFATGSLVAEVEPGMCTDSEVFSLLSEAIVEHVRGDEPVEKNFSFASPRRAGCKGG